MRKITVLEHLSLDGVIQGPGSRDEDASGGFMHGGWISPYSDASLGTALRKMLDLPIDLLLGRKTFELWATYWPQHGEYWPRVNVATKYVVSNTRSSHEWKPSVFLGGDIAEKVAALKRQQGPDLHVWGSGDLIQTLAEHDLIDAYWLMIYPVTLGSGKRLFADGTIPAAFEVTESTVTSKGVFIVNYERAGPLVTESL
jgi:dihydrofolate reductase